VQETIPARHWTRSPWVRGLAALNVALLGLVGVVALGPVATAQNEAPRRPVGEYMVVGGQDRAQNVSLLYIIDANNEEMVILQWDDSRNQLNGIGYRNLKDDAQRRGGR